MSYNYNYNQGCNNPCNNPCNNILTIFWGNTQSPINFSTSTSTPDDNGSGATNTQVNTIKDFFYSTSTTATSMGTKNEKQNYWTSPSGKFIDNEINQVSVSITNAGTLYFETNLRSSTSTDTSSGLTKGRFQILSATGSYLGKTGYVDYDAGNNRATIYLNPC
jgi:hypothetical protein